MLTAFAVLCLVGTYTCETHTAPFTGPETLYTRHAQLVAAEHYRPGLVVVRFGCRREL